MSSSIREMHKVSSFVTKKLLSGDAECSLRIQPFHLATRNVPSGEERGETAAMYSQASMSAAMKCCKCLLVRPRGGNWTQLIFEKLNVSNFPWVAPPTPRLESYVIVPTLLFLL